MKYINGLFLFLFMIGCGKSEFDQRSIFRYNEQTGIATLDPAFAKNQSIIWAVHQIYNSLVETDKDLNIVPSLAKSWEISSDRMTYRFHLRDDVFFQDNPCFPRGKGRRMVAADVAYSLKRIVDPLTASPGAWIFNNRVDQENGIRILSDTLIELKLARPFPPVLGMLSMQYCSIVPKEAVEKYGREFRNHPCGTGPFMLKYWEEGLDLILVRNPNYFEKDEKGQRLPYLQSVKISFFDNKATEFLMLQQGQLDFINDIDPTFKDEVLTKKGELRQDWNGKIILSKHPYLNTEYLGILCDSLNDQMKNSPLRLKNIRQAINYGFDRRKMMMYLRNSIGIPAESGFIPAGLPSFDSIEVKGYRYDPGKSRQLISEAGFPGGKGLPVIRLLTVAIYADLASFIAKELEEVGIKLQVEVIQKGLLLEEMANSQAQFFRGSWIADYPDAENYLSVFYSANPAPPNYTRYHDPVYDKWYEESLLLNNDSTRYIMYRQMDQRMIENAPVVPLWYDEVIHFVNPSVRNFEANGLNLLELRRVTKE
jgi:peptide/nickel transport system substrate-binding protein